MPKNKRVVFKLDAAYVQWIHDELLARLWPGTAPVPRGGCRDIGLLESAVNRPFQSAFGQDAYPDIVGKAAALFHSLVANHCFMDGNKRTAVLALQSFLVLNGNVGLLSNDEMYAVARETASHRVRGISPSQALDAIGATLKDRTISFSKVRSMSFGNSELPPLYDELIDLRRNIKIATGGFAALRKSGVNPAEFHFLKEKV